jgi:hypothetical protein
MSDNSDAHLCRFMHKLLTISSVAVSAGLQEVLNVAKCIVVIN